LAARCSEGSEIRKDRAAEPKELFSDTAIKQRICGPVMRLTITSKPGAPFAALAASVTAKRKRSMNR
jgi:hypothetical protein